MNKAVEEALVQERKVIVGIIEGSPIPTFVINRKHEVIFWNRACEELTGFAAGDMIGTDRHYMPFYGTKRPLIADLIVDQDIVSLEPVTMFAYLKKQSGIDRLERDEQGRPVVIDLKTGRVAHRHREDLRFYALLDAIRVGIPPRLVASFYLDLGGARTEPVTEAVLDATVARTIDAAHRLTALRAGTVAPQHRPSYACRWCVARTACTVGQAWVECCSAGPVTCEERIDCLRGERLQRANREERQAPVLGNLARHSDSPQDIRQCRTSSDGCVRYEMRDPQPGGALDGTPGR